MEDDPLAIAIADPFHLHPFGPCTFFDPIEEQRQTFFPFAHHNVVYPWTRENPFGIAADVSPAHHDHAFFRSLLDHLGDPKGFAMIGCERGRDAKDLGTGGRDGFPDLVPSQAEVVETAVELKRAFIVERIKPFEVAQFRRGGDSFLPIRPAVEDFDFVSSFSQRSG
jgi:hypothetical protein